MEDDLQVNGEHQTVRYVLQTNDELKIIFPPEERSVGLAPYECDGYYL